jgi:predicted Zn-dependent protease
VLFDLRSRHRRRAVQVVYLGLAIILGGGLVLFGVGAGNGNGGLLNAFTGNGSGNNQNSVLSSQEKTALKQTQKAPTDPSAWAALISARWENAISGSNYNSSTSTFTTAGKKELVATAQDWQKYTSLTKSPDPSLATLAARAYAQIGNYSQAAAAWSIVASGSPTSPKGWECLAANAYAAKQDREAALALTKALNLVPKLSKSTLKSEIQAAKTTPSVAQSC